LAAIFALSKLFAPRRPAAAAIAAGNSSIAKA
jgi:hypothetical protein